MKNVTSLYEDFVKSFNSSKNPFLLFDICNASENDHTRFLLRLLNWTDANGRYVFLESFLTDVLGLSAKGITNVNVTDQHSAQGNKSGSKGMIDLYMCSPLDV